MSTEKLDLTQAVKPKSADVGAEFARLEQLTRDLNKARHPAIAVPEGVKVASEGEYSAPSGADGATTTLADPIFGSPIPKAAGQVVQQSTAEAQPQPIQQVAQQSIPQSPLAPSSTDLSRLFFTGQSGAGKTHLVGSLGATEFTIQQPILDLLAEYFPGQQEHLGDFVNLVLMWGSGYVSDKVPITATRLMFADFARQKFGDDFGKPGFWTRKLLDRALEHVGPAVVSTVTDEVTFNALKEAGFVHVHVMASNPTIQARARRKGANNSLAIGLDNQVLKAISAQRDGAKLKVVWNDTATPPISSRLYDIGGFLAWVKANPGQTAVLGE